MSTDETDGNPHDPDGRPAGNRTRAVTSSGFVVVGVTLGLALAAGAAALADQPDGAPVALSDERTGGSRAATEPEVPAVTAAVAPPRAQPYSPPAVDPEPVAAEAVPAPAVPRRAAPAPVTAEPAEAPAATQVPEEPAEPREPVPAPRAEPVAAPAPAEGSGRTLLAVPAPPSAIGAAAPVTTSSVQASLPTSPGGPVEVAALVQTTAATVQSHSVVTVAGAPPVPGIDPAASTAGVPTGTTYTVTVDIGVVQPVTGAPVEEPATPVDAIVPTTEEPGTLDQAVGSTADETPEVAAVLSVPQDDEPASAAVVVDRTATDPDDWGGVPVADRLRAADPASTEPEAASQGAADPAEGTTDEVGDDASAAEQGEVAGATVVDDQSGTAEQVGGSAEDGGTAQVDAAPVTEDQAAVEPVPDEHGEGAEPGATDVGPDHCDGDQEPDAQA